MVLETLLSVKDVVKNPWHVFIFGIVISLISMAVSYLVFPENAGLLMVFLVTIISAPFMLRLLKYGEDREEKEVDKLGILDRINPFTAFFRQSEIFSVYTAFFAGVVIALSVAYIFLPEQFVEKAFSDQVSQIGRINALLGNFIVDEKIFNQILSNNLIVMSVSFVFALLFGVGAVFILAWNASVLSAAIGIVAKSSGIPSALLAFLPHGVFEIAAYFVAAIAGGIISVLVSERNCPDRGRILGDMVVLMVFAVILVAIGAYIESQAIIL